MSLPKLNAQQIINAIEAGAQIEQVLVPLVRDLGGQPEILTNSYYSTSTKVLYVVALLIRAEESER